MIRHTWESLIATLVGDIVTRADWGRANGRAAKPKMATDIPAEITTPDTVETRVGTLKFFDGMAVINTTRRCRGRLLDLREGT